MKQSRINNLPIIYADVFISLGDTCKPAFWLKNAKLRKEAMPLDWMRYYELDVVLDMLKNKDINYFSDFIETPVVNKITRNIKCKITNIECIHHFPIERTAEEYLPIFQEIFNKRVKRFRDTINKEKNICFVMSRTDDIHIILEFIQELQKIYPQKYFTIVNIRKSPNKNNINKYEFGKNAVLYDYLFDDTHENGDDEEKNGQCWKGNTKFWKSIMHKFHFNQRTPKKVLHQKRKYF